MKIKEILLENYKDIADFYGNGIKDTHSIPKEVTRLFDSVRAIDKCIAGRFVIAEEGSIWFVPVDSSAIHDSPEKQIQRDAKIIGLTGIGGECVQISKVVYNKSKNSTFYKSLLDQNKLNDFKNIHEFFYDLKNMTDAELVKELIKHSDEKEFDISKSHRNVIRNLFSYRDILLETFEKNLTSTKKIKYTIEPESKLEKIIAGFTNRFGFDNRDRVYDSFGHYNPQRMIEFTNDEFKTNSYKRGVETLYSLFYIASFIEIIKQEKVELTGYSNYKKVVSYLSGDGNYDRNTSSIPLPFNLKNKNKLTGFSNEDTKASSEEMEKRIHNMLNEPRLFGGNDYRNERNQVKNEFERNISLIGNFYEFTLHEQKNGDIKVILNTKNFGSKKLNDKAIEIIEEFSKEINKDNLDCYYDVYRKYGLEIKKLGRIKDDLQTLINEINYNITTSKNTISSAEKTLETKTIELEEKIAEAKEYGLKLDLKANL